jgi:hypothetical protein
LYDLSLDESEKNDVSAQYPEVISKIKTILANRKEAVIKEWNF